MNNFDSDLLKLQRNADALIEREKSRLRAEFASIDRANSIRPAAPFKPALAPLTMHDHAQNNPLLRKILRDMQR